MSTAWQGSLQEQGFGLWQAALSSDEVAWARHALEGLLHSQAVGVLRCGNHAYGVRNLLQLWPEGIRLIRLPAIQALLRQELGAQAGLVRGLFFDKPPGTPWTLPWHRDRTIAVRAALEGHGFGNATYKAGVPHLTAPPGFLSRMLTLRISLDPMQADNGPLVVQPGSHRVEHEHDADLEQANESPFHEVRCEAGDVFAMRPLLAHSSLKPQPGCKLQRRVIHLEFSPDRCLPGDLEWFHFEPIFPEPSEVSAADHI